VRGVIVHLGASPRSCSSTSSSRRLNVSSVPAAVGSFAGAGMSGPKKDSGDSGERSAEANASDAPSRSVRGRRRGSAVTKNDLVAPGGGASERGVRLELDGEAAGGAVVAEPWEWM
jgi:hypothetical protein